MPQPKKSTLATKNKTASIGIGRIKEALAIIAKIKSPNGPKERKKHCNEIKNASNNQTTKTSYNKGVTHFYITFVRQT